MTTETQRKLSPWRVLLALVILGFVTIVSTKWLQGWDQTKKVSYTNPWFAPYVDITATPRYPFEQLGGVAHNIILSFIVSDPDEACTPTWGGFYSLDQAGNSLDLDRRIARYRQQGGHVAISFGGLRNDELAVRCADTDQLLTAYQTVIERYAIDTVDFDLEGTGLTDKDALNRRALVIAELQKTQRAHNKNLAVWLTLPVIPQGLTPDGTDAVAVMLEHGVDIAGVNVMTMNYGQSRDDQHSMQYASEMALRETHRQLGILYQQADITLSDASLWNKIGATPMIGQNDIFEEIFTLEDARGLNQFAIDHGIARMSMWSANRDIQCGENYVRVTVVSDSCSGVTQDKLAYTYLLSAHFEGLIRHRAEYTTMSDQLPTVVQDNPSESPYPVWSETSTYLQGTKIVWHGNVYEAKWWTQGDLPDNPVLQSWETPWQLIGPVLPGERPVPQPTLPVGTYPEWSGLEIYEAGDRVLFNGVPYQAKWWTQGDSPAASSSSPDSSPWIVLTQQQIERILDQQQV